MISDTKRDNVTYKTVSKGYSKGEKRIKLILEAAEQLLIDSGYHNFSMRKVASKAGVSVGNLQYYFPSKDKLLESLLDKVIQNYLDTFEKFRGRYTPKEQFIEIMKSVINDIRTKHTSVFFPELWSMANHDKHISNIMDRMYGKYRTLVANIIGDINPNLNECQAQRLSLFITASLEGHTIFIGYKKPWTTEAENMIDISLQSFLWLIEHGDIPEDECGKLQCTDTKEE
ncbi:MAG: AcrR family transcriptional regulator [Colwellia sp.]|jgi:AcrR family transcriptional regulator